LQVLNSEEIDASDEQQDDLKVTSSGFPGSGLEQHTASSSTTNTSFEVGQLKEINLQLYQHAVKKILQNGKRE
jgi:hypothetical protein